MSFFSTIESEFQAIASKFLTPKVQTAVAGAIAMADVTHDGHPGAVKQGVAAGIVSSLFGIGEAIAHALVKLVFDSIAKSAPAVLAPLVTAGQAAVDQAVNVGGAQAETVVQAKVDKLVTSPFTQVQAATTPAGVLQAIAGGAVQPVQPSAAQPAPPVARPVAPVTMGEPVAGGSPAPSTS